MALQGDTAAPSQKGVQPKKAAASKSLAERFSDALASIDRQAPSLTYLGLGCWIAWNTIAFSGSFWLHETNNSNVTENLMLVHLLACFITLSLVALFANRISKWVAKNRATLAGGIVAAIGTLLLCNARPEVLGSGVPDAALSVLFTAGCALAGAGTTMLFVRAAALFGTLAPHRALYRLAECTLFSIATYFVLSGCPQPVAVAAFIALPIIGAALFCIRQRDVRGERQVLATPVKLSRKFWVLLVSIGLCSTALELIRAYVLISVPPVYAIGTNVASQLIEIPLMVGIMFAILLTKSRRDGFAKLYSVAACALTVLQKPPLSPPSWVFPAVWSVLYIFMGISAANIYIIGGKRAEKAFTVYFVQLFLNFFWSILFFGFGAYFLAFLWLCLLFAAVRYMIYLFYKINPRAAFLQVPYLLWLAFAGYLNFMFFILN